MKPIFMVTLLRGVATAALITCLMAPVSAETITIGKGSGILWEGMAFNQTLSGPLNHESLSPSYGLLAISDSRGECMSSSSSKLITIGNTLVLKIAPGIGLIPRASGTANYTSYWGAGVLQGDIGLPKTEGTATTFGKVTSPANKVWCLPPSMTGRLEFYSASAPRTASLAGTWVLMADGTQQAGEATIPAMYFGSFASATKGDLSKPILPSSITLRISTLECSVNTPLAIDFGNVVRNTQANAELAVKQVPLITTCGQASDRINANINLQFRAISGLYGNAASRLALSQQGGYITGEINNGLTGSGVCTATSGLRFDNTAVKLGSITNMESSKTFSHQLTWRLCSGGNSLPSGAVNASAEMQVTFN